MSQTLSIHALRPSLRRVSTPLRLLSTSIALLPAILGLLALTSIVGGAGTAGFLVLLRWLRSWGHSGAALARRLSGKLRSLSTHSLKLDVRQRQGRQTAIRLVAGTASILTLRMLWRLRITMQGFDPSLRMNVHETTLDADLQEKLLLRDLPKWGPGWREKFVEGVWKPYLHGELTAKENLEEIHNSLGLVSRSSAEMTIDQLTEGVRNVLMDKYPQDMATGQYWSQEQAQCIAQALAVECGLPQPLPQGFLEECVPCRAHNLVPWPTPPLLDVLQRKSLGFLHLLHHSGLSLQSRFVEMPLGRMHVLDSCVSNEAAQHFDEPPLLICHGMFVTGWSMALLGWFMSQRRRVVIPDLFDFEYGYSTSNGLKNNTPIRKIGDHVDALLNIVCEMCGPGHGQSIDICGHSFGGIMVAMLAKRCEKQGLPVRKVVLLSPGGNGCRQIGNPWMARVMHTPMETIEEVLPSWIPHRPAKALLAASLGVMLSANNCNIIFGQDHEAFLGPRAEWSEAQGPCTDCPTLLLWGDQDQVAWPRCMSSLQKFLNGTLPNLDAFWVEGATHNVQLDSVVAVASAMDSWLSLGTIDGRVAAPSWIVRAFLGFTNRRLYRMQLDNNLQMNDSSAREKLFSKPAEDELPKAGAARLVRSSL